jgi:hypothetical protein
LSCFDILSRVDVRQLRYFRAIVEHGSFNKGTKRCIFHRLR